MELEQNCKTMKVPWNPLDRFEILRKRFNEMIISAAFAENNTSAGNTLNLILSVILKTGVFQVLYKEWYNLPGAQHTLVNALEWWGKNAGLKTNLQNWPAIWAPESSTELRVRSKEPSTRS